MSPTSIHHPLRAQDARVIAAKPSRPHVFPNCPGVLQAADQALETMTSFVARHLQPVQQP